MIEVTAKGRDDMLVLFLNTEIFVVYQNKMLIYIAFYYSLGSTKEDKVILKHSKTCIIDSLCYYSPSIFFKMNLS